MKDIYIYIYIYMEYGDESGCFFKVLPSKGLAQKWKKCKGRKKSNQKIAVALLFFVSAEGGKVDKPI